MLDVYLGDPPKPRSLVLSGKNHYDVIDGFLDAGSPLCSAVLDPVRLE